MHFFTRTFCHRIVMLTLNRFADAVQAAQVWVFGAQVVEDSSHGLVVVVVEVYGSADVASHVLNGEEIDVHQGNEHS